MRAILDGRTGADEPAGGNVSVSTRSRRPRDSQALNPAAWKLAIGVTAAVVVFLLLVFGAIASVGHRNDVIAHLTGDWRPSAGDSSTQLAIWPKAEDGIGLPQAPAVTPLELSGVVERQKVSGEVTVPRWPPFGSSAYAIVSGARWTLRVDLERDTLTVVTADGLTFVLSPTR
jgi:hypothetical protein